VPLLFAVTLFVSASLLFMVQPMVGKMILPLLGGSPAVWNACMVFFQAMLLAGYLYSHRVSTRLEPKKQGIVHGLVLLAPIVVMALAIALSARHSPIAVVESLAPSGDSSPFLAAMAILLVAIGVPFVFVSTSAPLLQKWFSYTGHPSANDPYFLYAASNAGSLISLLGYPLFIEPNFSVSGQAWLFGIGFVVMAVLIGLCANVAANPIGTPPPPAPLRKGKLHKGYEPTDPPPPGYKATPAPLVSDPTEPPPSTLRVLKWIALAFVPSSWMLGVTFYMTTDIASVPLLWVVPLALYLVTFIIAFGRVAPWFRLVIGNLAPVMILLLMFVILGRDYLRKFDMALELALHIATFFVAALMCHYELARDRPKDVAHLTKYFLMMSVGGVLGGLFNAIVAPIVFTWAPTAYEYYVTMVVACLMVPDLNAPENGQAAVPADTELARFKRKLRTTLDFLLPAIVGLVFWLAVSVIVKREFFKGFVNGLTKNVGFLENSQDTIAAISLIAIPVMSCFFFVDRAFRFALAVAILLTIHLYRAEDSSIVYNERTFFGILKVEQQGAFTRLVHGTTLHGTQISERYRLHPADVAQAFGASPLNLWDSVLLQGSLEAWRPREEPLTYYHRTGPVGAMFHELRSRKNGADAKADIAMVGLGSGSVACYALPGQRLTFYEIDSAVRRIVETPWMVMNKDEVAEGKPAVLGPFTYVDAAKNRGARVDFRMGDARLKLKEDTDRKYALLLVDAFSSDAIPVHLLTKQAVELYMNRITDDGILALHISNKYVALEPVVAKIAEDLNLEARVWSDGWEDPPGKTSSHWVVLARKVETLGVLAASPAEQAVAFGVKNPPLIELLKEYGPNQNARDALLEKYGKDFTTLPSAADPTPKETGLPYDDFRAKYGKPAAELIQEVRRGGDLTKSTLTLGDLVPKIYRDLFVPLTVLPDVPLWTDDYSDVLRVMTLEEVQWVRNKLGLPTPVGLKKGNDSE